jgi:hypothetical protein
VRRIIEREVKVFQFVQLILSGFCCLLKLYRWKQKTKVLLAA